MLISRSADDRQTRSKDSLWCLSERVPRDGEVATQSNFVSRLAVDDGASGGVCRGYGHRLVGELQDIDLEVGERVPETRLDERRQRLELYDGHRGRRKRGREWVWAGLKVSVESEEAQRRDDP